MSEYLLLEQLKCPRCTLWVGGGGGGGVGGGDEREVRMGGGREEEKEVRMRQGTCLRIVSGTFS